MPLHSLTGMENNRLRFSGLASGIDTGGMIKQLMRAERMKIDRVAQDRQVLEWRRDSYRNITNMLRGFQDKYFDLLRPATNFRSPSAFSSFKVNSSNEGAVSAVAGTGAQARTHKIEVHALASSAKIEGLSGIAGDVKGSGTISEFNFSGEKINVTLDGVTRTINLQDYSNIDVLREGINNALSEAFGAGKIEVLTSENSIEFSLLLNGSTFSISENSGSKGTLENLGFTQDDSKSNRLSMVAGLESIKNNFKSSINIDDAQENVSFTINGTVIDVGKTYEKANIRDIMNAINRSSAGVRIQYDSLNDKFTMTSTTQGATSSITYEDTHEENGLLKALGLVDGVYSQGTDAEFTLNDVEGMKRSSNDFVIEGVNFSLRELTTEPVLIDISNNIDAVVDNIKGFVNQYNELIDEINGVVSERRDRNYRPLTAEQKDVMTDDEIEKWEERARMGLLSNDSILSGIVNNMRRALFDRVEGTSINLFDIGISTGLYTERGKLNINETKLMDALNNNFDEVVKLFTQTSEHSQNDVIGDRDKQIERYNQSGLAQRLFDIMQTNIRTTRDTSGKKGALLERAGIVGDSTEFKNTIVNEITSKDSIIERMLDSMSKKEEAYYSRFTAMEKMLSQMESQSSWLMTQLGN
ncbi:UNVERIFIED_CONTAM: flagellar hook-associated protein 2 [Acetivibrio alkalicellulosi]